MCVVNFSNPLEMMILSREVEILKLKFLFSSLLLIYLYWDFDFFFL
ncbi:MAG: hypothetical protein N3D19_04280 [Archaeoglobaceae archaeon]|nr:hypothetical protein [Archaeoglobaceae archaeon]